MPKPLISALGSDSMIAIIDYGVGNLFSLQSSLKAIGEDAAVTADKELINSCSRIILPGVGAFGDAVQKLHDAGLFEFVREQAQSGKPVLGICLGMQMLLEKSYEFGEFEGLGLIEGSIEAIEPKLKENLDIPHMGWNALHFTDRKCPLFKDIREGEFVYFVHSYAAFGCEKDLAAYAEYEIPLTAAVWKDNVYGTQFHPEKSGPAGLKILKNFCTL